MALGGGTFTAQNKILPGTYINFVSASASSATLSDRGIVAMGFKTGWGKTGEIIEITSGDFQKNSMEIFGHDYTDPTLKDIREIFRHAVTLYAYRLDGGGVKASNDIASAKYPGTVGNSIIIKVEKDVDDTTKYNVSTYVGTELTDTQTVAASSELVGNAFVDFKTVETLTETTGTPLTGGTDSEMTGAVHQAFLDALESYSFNALACMSTEDTVKSLYTAYCKRMREEVGKKFQVVVYDKAADYEGVINVKNGVELVPWVTGLAGGIAVNESAGNMIYDGENTVGTPYTQLQLEKAIASGEFTFHRVNGVVRVLTDINSLVSTTDTKGKAFKSNQTIRVIDQIANDVAVIFNENYIGKIPNTARGRSFLRDDIISHHEQLLTAGAIDDFESEDVTVAAGIEDTSVVVTDAVTPVHAMEKLYMTVTVS